VRGGLITLQFKMPYGPSGVIAYNHRVRLRVVTRAGSWGPWANRRQCWHTGNL